MSPIYITAIICIIIVIGFLAYYYYIYKLFQMNYNKYKIPLLLDETEFNEDYTNTKILSSLVTDRKTLSVQGLGYGVSFSWEMNISNLSGNDKWNNSFNLLKPILKMNDSPQISYHPKKNYLSIILKYRDNPFYVQFAEFKYEDVKLQKWSKYILVINDRNVLLFVDGLPVFNKYLPSVPVIYDIQSKIILGQVNNNFLGKIRNLTLYPYPLTYTEIISI